MSFVVNFRYGRQVENPPLTQLAELVAELDSLGEPEDNTEHPDVSIVHESEWSLTAYPSGLLVWENVESTGAPQYMTGVSRQSVLRLFEKLARGAISEIETEPWLEGSPPFNT